MAFDRIPYALNSVPVMRPGVNALSLNPNARCAGFVEQAYAFFGEAGPYVSDLGSKQRTAVASAAANSWKPNQTVAGLGVKITSTTGHFAATGHQLRPWSRECLFVYGAAGVQEISTIAETPGGSNDRGLYVNASGQAASYVYDNVGKTVTTTTVLVVGRAYHVTVTASNSLLSIYLNGVLEASVAINNAGYQGYTTPELVFGRGGGGGGGVDNTLFWSVEYNQVLSAEDVRHRYLNQMEMFKLSNAPPVVAAAGGNTVLGPQDLTSGFGYEAPALAQVHNFSPADAFMAGGFETPGFSQAHNFNPADAFIAVNFETPLISIGGQLNPAKSFLAANFETAALSQAHMLSAQEINMAVLFDAASLAQSAPGAPGFRTRNLAAPSGGSFTVSQRNKTSNITE